MAITGGVYSPVGFLILAGGNYPVISAEVSLTATKKSGTYSAVVPMDILGGVSLTGAIDGGVAISRGGGPTVLITGPVKSAKFNYANRLVTVSGQDKSAELHRNKSSEKFTNKTPTQIIQDVAGRVGLSANINVSDSSLLAGKINQIEWAKLTEDTSFASIIHKMSEFLGAHWSVKGSTLTVTDQTASGGYLVSYTAPVGGGPATGNFIDLEITRNLDISQGVKVQVKSWHSRKKKVFTSTQSTGGGKHEFQYHIPNLEQDHVDKHARSALKDHAKHEICVTVEMVGDPSIDILQGLQLTGTNDFDQSYEIQTINHSIGEHGYTMKIEAKGPGSGNSGGGGSANSSTATSGAGSNPYPLPIMDAGTPTQA